VAQSVRPEFKRQYYKKKKKGGIDFTAQGHKLSTIKRGESQEQWGSSHVAMELMSKTGIPREQVFYKCADGRFLNPHSSPAPANSHWEVLQVPRMWD
jgi:hypothetical protein